jgi:hypothetical protein
VAEVYKGKSLWQRVKEKRKKEEKTLARRLPPRIRECLFRDIYIHI